MTETTCACQKLERLEGAATPAYITHYLERDRAASGNLYRCRMCGAMSSKLSSPF